MYGHQDGRTQPNFASARWANSHKQSLKRDHVSHGEANRLGHGTGNQRYDLSRVTQEVKGAWSDTEITIWQSMMARRPSSVVSWARANGQDMRP
jgi:hypothetical protein